MALNLRVDASAWRFERDALSYGVRLGAAVLLAFGMSALLHLPEGFWAVMSALIVVRPETGGTLGAGWNRIRGALVGTGLGLLGALLRRHAPSADAMGLAPLLLVTVLAFAGGLTPALRSAPISALIVITSGGIAGHSASEVALLRALEIGLGIGAALIVSLADRRSRATIRFRAAAASHLRDLADGLTIEASGPVGTGDEREETRRAALRRLAILADAADRECRVLGRERGALADRHRRSARLLARIGHDAALFERLRVIDASLDAPVATLPDAPPRTVETVAAASLRTFAEALQQDRWFELPDRGAAAAQLPDAGDSQVALRLLDGDLLALGRLEGLHRARRPPDRGTTVP